MKIGIVGIGVVGSALCHLFGTNGYKVKKYDKYKKIGSVSDINGCDVAFICVPTPFSGKHGKVDTSAVEECVSWIKAPNIVIKSTVPPGTTRMLAEKYKKRIFHNPEFLTEKNAKKDIFMEGRVVIGYVDFRDMPTAYGLGCFLAGLQFIHSDIFINKSEVTELLKYANNAFLTMKVVFCNEMDLIARKYDANWNMDLRDAFIRDKRIGESHTKVTKERGYGGHCFPKDLDGLISFSNSKFFKAVKEQNERTKAYKIPQA